MAKRGAAWAENSRLILRASLAKALREMAEGLTHVNRSELTSEQIRENTDAQVRLAARVAALRPIDRGERFAMLPK